MDAPRRWRSRDPVKLVRVISFLARRNPQSHLALVMILASIRVRLELASLPGRIHSGTRFAIVHIRVQQRDKINKKRLEFKLAAINFIRSHPTGDSRFKMLGSAPRQRASGLPRTTPRSPFLKPKTPGVCGHVWSFRDQPASRSDFEQPGERWLFGIRSLAGFLFPSIDRDVAGRRRPAMTQGPARASRYRLPVFQNELAVDQHMDDSRAVLERLEVGGMIDHGRRGRRSRRRRTGPA